MNEKDAFKQEQPAPATMTKYALDELEEKYESLRESVRADKFNPKYINRYIAHAEKRRGTPFTRTERNNFRELALSKDPKVIEQLAFDLRIGVPKKIELEAMAAMGRFLMHHNENDALEEFLEKPTNDPQIKHWVYTTLMMNKVEYWIGRYKEFRNWLAAFTGKAPNSKDKEENQQKKKKQQQPKNGANTNSPKKLQQPQAEKKAIAQVK